ncbi:MAG: TerC family protein, partial [Aurantibacter sp.]
ILTWGILGALILRGVFIFMGFYLIDLFHGVLYLFAGFLIFSGIMLFFDKGEEGIEPEKNLVYRFAKKFLPMKKGDHQGKFFAKENGKLLITPLFLVLLLIESSDMFFAADSIPAAFAISDSRFIIFTSNIFAVLGLRALFFLLASVIDKFYLLQKGLSFILVFIGVKMAIGMLGFELPTYITFSVIIFCLFSAIMTSIIIPAPTRASVAKKLK